MRLAKPFITLAVGIIAVVATTTLAPLRAAPEAAVTPVAFDKVRLGEGFWASRIRVCREVTIPYCFKQCEKTGRIDNFAIAAGLKQGTHIGAPYNDSDVYKIIEGAAYSLQSQPDPVLEQYLDGMIATITAAQQSDGYLFTYYTPDPADQRFKHISPGPKHELYCMGHFIEAAVAHFNSTGKRPLLDAAIRLADHLDSIFGPGKRHNVPHHPELESALIKLYQTTHQPRYLELARFFIDQRGHTDARPSVTFYGQDHLPLRQQTEIVGHAVRAMYNCVNLTALYQETGDPQLLAAARRLWESATQRKLYVTGGIGALGRGESFGNDYQLPNGSAYSETCAAIGLVFFAHRMWQIQPDAEYIDVLERALYNTVLDGVALAGNEFFYPNKLLASGEAGWGAVRRKWYDCACCPSNLCRFIPAVPGYLYGQHGDDIYINSFMAGTATINTGRQTVSLTQQTAYPWDGSVTITVAPAAPAEFTIKVRIPGWARNHPSPGDLYRYAEPAPDEPVRLQVNGHAASLDLEHGYAVIKRTWHPGDVIQLSLPMPVRRVLAHDKVLADVGLVAIERGPIVYCAEGPDNGAKVLDITLDDTVALRAEPRADLLGGVTVVTGTLTDGRKLTAIPYYAHANRGRGEMNVWLARTAAVAKRIAVEPFPKDWESWGDLKASHVYPPDQLAALTDEKTPTGPDARDVPRFTWLYHVGVPEWVQQSFPHPTAVSAVAVYWLDEAAAAGPCRVPKSWRVLYRNGEKWQPVESATPCGTVTGTFNQTTFNPVTTTAIRVEAVLQDDFSAGILEWRITTGKTADAGSGKAQEFP
ncbi:MAG: glycoside hydrolase family 127 protein [Verrucomicrobiota bacterium]